MPDIGNINSKLTSSCSGPYYVYYSSYLWLNNHQLGFRCDASFPKIPDLNGLTRTITESSHYMLLQWIASNSLYFTRSSCSMCHDRHYLTALLSTTYSHIIQPHPADWCSDNKNMRIKPTYWCCWFIGCWTEKNLVSRMASTLNIPDNCTEFSLAVSM